MYNLLLSHFSINVSIYAPLHCSSTVLLSFGLACDDKLCFLIFSGKNWDGRVVRAFASRAVNSGLISSRVKPMTLKLVFTAFLLDVQHQRNGMENKHASLLVVPLGKAFSEIPHLGPLGVVDRWPATSKEARYSALITCLQ